MVNESYTVTITDFDFSIDLTGYIADGPTHFSLPDDVPAYRGLMVRQVMAGRDGDAKAKIRRKATKEEIEAYKEDEKAHDEAGLPPWQDLGSSRRSDKSPSSMTLRDWADEYAASRKKLKELVYEKVRSFFASSTFARPFMLNYVTIHFKSGLTILPPPNRKSMDGTLQTSRTLSDPPYKAQATPGPSTSPSFPPAPAYVSAQITASPAPSAKPSGKSS